MKTYIVTAEMMFIGYRGHCTTMTDAISQAEKLRLAGASGIKIDGVPYCESIGERSRGYDER